MRLLKKLSECESMAVANPNQNHPTCLLKNTNLSPKLKKVYAGIKSPRPYSDRKSEQSGQMNEKSWHGNVLLSLSFFTKLLPNFFLPQIVFKSIHNVRQRAKKFQSQSSDLLVVSKILYKLRKTSFRSYSHLHVRIFVNFFMRISLNFPFWNRTEFITLYLVPGVHENVTKS